MLIDEDNSDVGWYLYVWKDGENINDFLQDTLEIAKKQAFDEFNMPYGLWKKITQNIKIDFTNPSNLKKIYNKL